MGLLCLYLDRIVESRQESTGRREESKGTRDGNRTLVAVSTGALYVHEAIGANQNSVIFIFKCLYLIF